MMTLCKRHSPSLLVMAVVALSLTIVLSQQCSAVTTAEQMANWPVPMYQGEELEKVREWEKTWVGKRINQDNIDQVKDFLSEQFYGMYSKPEDWGAEELWFEIITLPADTTHPGTTCNDQKVCPHRKA